jgi:hypothetical protein
LYAVKASAFDMPEHGFFTALVELSKLWLDSIRGELSEAQTFERSKRILSHLNIDHEMRSKRSATILTILISWGATWTRFTQTS